MENKISLQTLNELFNNKSKYFKNHKKGHQGIGNNNSNGHQGEHNEYFKFYKHPELPEGVFMRETYNTDSYGDNDFIVKVEFVKGKEKQITVFEPLN